MKPDLTEYEEEIDRLDRMAEKLDSLGVGENHKAIVQALRLRLVLLKVASLLEEKL